MYILWQNSAIMLLQYSTKEVLVLIKTLTTHGNSSALIIDKPIMELLNIDNSTPLKIVTDGKSLIISPVTDLEREKRFQAALRKVNANHGETLRKLGE